MTSRGAPKRMWSTLGRGIIVHFAQALLLSGEGTLAYAATSVVNSTADTVDASPGNDGADAANYTFHATIMEASALPGPNIALAAGTLTPTRTRTATPTPVPTVCRDILLEAGVDDNFSAANGAEPAAPSAGLLALMGANPPPTGFDGASTDRHFGHTFILPQGDCVTAARLEFRAKPLASSVQPGSDNDSIALGFVPSGSFVNAHWSAYFGSGNSAPGVQPNPWVSSNYPTGLLFSWDLHNLQPGGPQHDLLPDLNTKRFLDIYVQDDTSVDYARLVVSLCDCPIPTPTSTATATPTPSRSFTPTNTRTFTPTRAPTRTSTPTRTATNTFQVVALPPCQTPGQVVDVSIGTAVSVTPPQQDPRWYLIAAPPSQTGAFPAYSTNPAAGWVTPTPPVQWIQRIQNVNPQADSGGNYTFRLQITLNPALYSNVQIAGRYSADNTATVQLNSVQQSACSGPSGNDCFKTWQPLTIASGFVTGVNTLDLIVFNQSNITGLVVEANLQATCLAPTPTSTSTVTTTPTGTPTRTPSPAPCDQPPPCMVAWWPLNETGGTLIDDIWFNNLDGTSVNANGVPAPVNSGGPSSVSGQHVGNSLYFAGEYVEANYPQLDFGTGEFSIDAWVKVNGIPNPSPTPGGPASETIQPIVDKTSQIGGIANGYALFLHYASSQPFRLGFVMDDGVGGATTSLLHPAPLLGGWYHVAVTVARPSVTQAVVTLYVNGQPSSPVTLTVGSTSNPAALWIGKSRLHALLNAPYFQEGTIDELEIFDCALAQPDIQQIYNAQQSGKCTPTPGATVTPTAPKTPTGCVGDCDGNGVVTVNEIILMVNIALGNLPLSACNAGDADQNGSVSINEIITAVNNALNGCPCGFIGPRMCGGSCPNSTDVCQPLPDDSGCVCRPGERTPTSTVTSGRTATPTFTRTASFTPRTVTSPPTVTPTCAEARSLLVSTGNASIGGNDPIWSLVGAPAGTANFPPARPAIVIGAYGGWSTVPSTQWITANTVCGHTTGCPAGTYQYEFCWQQCGELVDPTPFMALADNRANVFLDNNFLIAVPGFSIPTSFSLNAGPGTHSLRVDVVNDLLSGVQTPTGMDLSGILNGQIQIVQCPVRPPTFTATPSTTPSPTATAPTPTRTVTATFTMSPSPTATPHPSNTPTGTPTSATPTRTRTATTTATRSATPTVPAPTSTPTPSGFTEICVLKFNDANGNGMQDAGESGLGGWSIEITDLVGNVVAFITTGAGGSFCTGVPAPATYTVFEVPQAGWAQTFPAPPGVHTVTVAPAQLLNLAFGNQRTTNTPTVTRTPSATRTPTRTPTKTPNVPPLG